MHPWFNHIERQHSAYHAFWRFSISLYQSNRFLDHLGVGGVGGNPPITLSELTAEKPVKEAYLTVTEIESYLGYFAMPEEVFLEPRRFAAAAKHYLAGRPAYAQGLISRIVKELRLGAKDAVMDLGCGAGQLAMLFVPFVRSVLAVDPSAEMLAVARHAATGADNVHFKSGSSFDIGPELGTFKLVTIGRAFHWMDRPDTLQRLDVMLERDGGPSMR